MGARTKRAIAILGKAGLSLRDRRKVDPVQRAMENAPYDDEPLTEEEERSLDEAEQSEFLSLEEVRASLARDRKS